jgi:putative ABC transport system permease protein
MRYTILIFKNLRRNLVRSILTVLGTMVLVLVVTLVWSILDLLNAMTQARNDGVKAMVTEKWAIPSRLPFAYARTLEQGAAQSPGDIRPKDSMTWQFYGGTTEPGKITRESMVFVVACDPGKILSMMEGLADDLPENELEQVKQAVDALAKKRTGIILGYNHALATKKKVGDRLKLYGFSTFKDLDFEFEVVGVYPPGRYDTLAAFNRDYLNNELDSFPKTHGGRTHPLASRSLAMVWLKVDTMDDYNRLAAQIERSPEFRDPPVKCETASSGMASFMESFRDLIWGMRWLLAPTCLVTLSLVIANAISISVRERRTELAVLKVLGFRPWQLLFLVLGESLFLGVSAGFLSSGLTYVAINIWLGGISFPIGFIQRFMIPEAALWWGPAVGGLAALAGSIVPALGARKVKAAEVFSKVA